jgi:SAM-dependent methyltransferase
MGGEDWGGTVQYGPGVGDERALRLLGPLNGRRVLLLGSGAGQAAVALASSGARVIAVEPSANAAEAARRLCAARRLSIEIHERDLAELAFVRAETIDVVLSVFALAGVADLPRVFRQVHRVLRSEAPIVFSLPHPVGSLFDDTSGRLDLRRRYGQTQPVGWAVGEISGVDHGHTVEAVVTALGRAGFRVDILLEPLATPTQERTANVYWRPLMEQLPTALILRARKRGM